MPNAKYIKGRRKEYKIVNEAKKMGFLAFRSAGSHSPIDVVIIDKIRKKICFVQSKSDSMSNNSKMNLEEENSGLNGMFECEFRVE